MIMDKQYRHGTVEALILASPDPLPAKRIAQVADDLTPSAVAAVITDLNERYAQAGLSLRIREIAGGYQHYIIPEFVGYVEELFARRRKLRLTRAALETAAITAYRQPVTKAEIEHIRGVASDGVLQNLLEKNMLRIIGRAETVGKPLQYGTTDEFLKFFGLNSLADLPKMSEIEELINSQEAKSQTQLELETPRTEQQPVKLNVVDGTFDPERRRRRVEDGAAPDEPAPGEDEASRVTRTEEPATVTENGAVVPAGEKEAQHKLLLRTPAEQVAPATDVLPAKSSPAEELSQEDKTEEPVRD